MVSRNAVLTGVIAGIATALATAWLTSDVPVGSPAWRLMEFLRPSDGRGITEGVPPMDATEVRIDG